MPTTPISEIPLGVPRSTEWRKHQVLQSARMDLGKPKLNAYVQETGPICQRWAKFVVVEVPDWQKPWKLTVYMAAKGTVLVISPWNFPLPDAVVLKPSELSPHFAELLAELFPKYLDPAAYRVVLGDVPEITKILELQWDHIFYIGNGRIACIISAPAAKHLTPLVDPSFDIKLAAKRTLWQKRRTALCVAPDYLELDLSPEHHARLVDLLARTRGEVVLGGKTEGDEKIEITVGKDVGADDSFMEGCICGPFLPILPVDNVEEALEFVRNRCLCSNDHPLVLYAFTENSEMKKKILEKTMSGGIAFGDLVQQLAVKELLFGGVGESRYGSQVLKYPYEAFSYNHSTVDIPHEAEPFSAVRYPPYDEEKFKVMSAAAFLEIPTAI
ncbi:aldehyde dehydrogenase [Mycena vulgaris]|nr:aldehyde dehydrogenase [Mycena vulgaris]